MDYLDYNLNGICSKTLIVRALAAHHVLNVNNVYSVSIGVIVVSTILKIYYGFQV